MRRLLLSTALLAAFVTPGAAALLTVTDFTTDAASVSVVSTPPDDLVAASLISGSWTAETVQVPLGGLAHGDPVTLTNPIHLAVGSTVSVSWDSGAFHDITTVASISSAADAIALDAHGELFGPGVGANTSNLQLAWTQAGGTGFAISGSGSYTAQSVIPETSTWIMLGIGFGAMALASRFRKQSSRFLEV